MALEDLQSLVTGLVRDEAAAIAGSQRDQAIGLAVLRYGSDRPRLAVEDLVSEAGGHQLALPAGWEPGFSRLNELESPPDQVPPRILPPADWRLYDTPDGQVILLASRLSAGAVVRARYGIAHRLDAETDTIPARDREAVACWAAALLLEQLASLAAGHQAPTIQADTVDWQRKAADYGRRAESLRKRYLDALGVEDRRAAAHGTVVRHEPKDSRGQSRLLRRA